MRKIHYILPAICLFCLLGCQDQKRIEELESKFSLLEKQRADIEKENDRLRAERDSIQRANYITNLLLNQAEEEKKTKHEVRQIQTLPATPSQSNLRRLGSVDLYKLDENNNLEKIEWWWVVPYGQDFGLYLNRTGGVDSYELHMGSAIYHVSIGKFRLSAKNGYFEFSAHAGEYYFDI